MEKVYRQRKLDQISYPMGGFGTGMLCLEGNGAIGKVSLHHTPEFYNEPNMFAAVTLKGNRLRVYASQTWNRISSPQPVSC